MTKRELIEKEELCYETVTTDDYSGNEILDVVLKDDIEDCHIFTEQEIVKPYLENLKEQIRYDYNRNIWGQYEYEKVMDLINNLLSEQEDLS